VSFALRLHGLIVALINLEHRADPYFRDWFDARFQQPLQTVLQTLINFQRPNEHLAIAEEKPIPGEEAIAHEIVEQMAAYLAKHYQPGTYQRAGNTKTYGVVRGELSILSDLPGQLRHGVFSEPHSYPAWVRFAGPGPLAPPDLDDNGVLSIGIKLMGVEGHKLGDDERFTQDFTGISAPTFTTPNVVENLKLQRQSNAGTPAFYFFNLSDPHILDALMQGLYSRTNTSPLEVTYYSCVAYLLGERQAMHYAVKPSSSHKTPVPRSPSANYLREAMAATLADVDVEFDFMIQLQTDAHRMPIEDASVVWPESLSPFVPMAKLRIPAQRFDSPAQLAFAGNLSFNPWHSIAAHRPLGNQNRARRIIYYELSKLRQRMNDQPHIEPTGAERF